MLLKATGGRINLSLALILGLTLVSSSLSFNADPPPFGNPAFKQLWNHTDQQVAQGQVSRSYLWGPEPFTPTIQEPYAGQSHDFRLVQYFDKSRMEINNPDADKSNPFYVTNGLLTRDMIKGLLQLGDNLFDNVAPAEIGVAGDIDDTSGPTYKTLNAFTDGTNDATGNLITQALDREGHTRNSPDEFGKYNVTQADFESLTGHNIAGPFWAYLNQTGPVLGANGETVTGPLFEPVFYATGLPITEAWWAKVKVGGVIKDVLVQAFERRILTYTPSNPAAYQVEMGNVGRHYYLWRYGPTGEGPATPTPVSSSNVMIHNFSFVPQIITVPKGTTVTWTNMDSTGHTVTSNTVDSGPLGTGDTFSFTFNTPGTFSYHCSIHESMTGMIIVTG
jgi:plastocyanin